MDAVIEEKQHSQAHNQESSGKNPALYDDLVVNAVATSKYDPASDKQKTERHPSETGGLYEKDVVSWSQLPRILELMADPKTGPLRLRFPESSEETAELRKFVIGMQSRSFSQSYEIIQREVANRVPEARDILNAHKNDFGSDFRSVSVQKLYDLRSVPTENLASALTNLQQRIVEDLIVSANDKPVKMVFWINNDPDVAFAIVEQAKKVIQSLSLLVAKQAKAGSDVEQRAAQIFVHGISYWVGETKNPGTAPLSVDYSKLSAFATSAKGAASAGMPSENTASTNEGPSVKNETYNQEVESAQATRPPVASMHSTDSKLSSDEDLDTLLLEVMNSPEDVQANTDETQSPLNKSDKVSTVANIWFYESSSSGLPLSDDVNLHIQCDIDSLDLSTEEKSAVAATLNRQSDKYSVAVLRSKLLKLQELNPLAFLKVVGKLSVVSEGCDDIQILYEREMRDPVPPQEPSASQAPAKGDASPETETSAPIKPVEKNVSNTVLTEVEFFEKGKNTEALAHTEVFKVTCDVDALGLSAEQKETLISLFGKIKHPNKLTSIYDRISAGDLRENLFRLNQQDPETFEKFKNSFSLHTSSPYRVVEVRYQETGSLPDATEEPESVESSGPVGKATEQQSVGLSGLEFYERSGSSAPLLDADQLRIKLSYLLAESTDIQLSPEDSAAFEAVFSGLKREEDLFDLSSELSVGELRERLVKLSQTNPAAFSKFAREVRIETLNTSLVDLRQTTAAASESLAVSAEESSVVAGEDILKESSPSVIEESTVPTLTEEVANIEKPSSESLEETAVATADLSERTTASEPIPDTADLNISFAHDFTGLDPEDRAALIDFFESFEKKDLEIDHGVSSFTVSSAELHERLAQLNDTNPLALIKLKNIATVFSPSKNEIAPVFSNFEA